jgi:hypothetical protein
MPGLPSNVWRISCSGQPRARTNPRFHCPPQGTQRLPCVLAAPACRLHARVRLQSRDEACLAEVVPSMTTPTTPVLAFAGESNASPDPAVADPEQSEHDRHGSLPQLQPDDQAQRPTGYPDASKARRDDAAAAT